MLRSRDTDLMLDALAALGATVEASRTEVRIEPAPLRPANIEVGLAGTVLRFLAALAPLAGKIHFTGDEAMARRPIGPLLEALSSLGAGVEVPAGASLPLTITGPARGGRVCLDSSASSQFLSALLLAAPRYSGGLDIELTGAVPSGPHVTMTVALLEAAGATVEKTARGWTVAEGPLNPGDIHVEPDLSNAAPFLAAAAVTGGRVSTPWPPATTQPGALFPEILTRMGANATREGENLVVEGGPLTGIDIDMSAAGELVPTLAAVAACASTPTRITGVGHLRGHETDRLAALEAELTRVGAHARATEDGLVIEPGEPRGAMVRSYADHRMATFGAIVGLHVPGVSVEDITCTSKTLPTFPQMWMELVEGSAESAS